MSPLLCIWCKPAHHSTQRLGREVRARICFRRTESAHYFGRLGQDAGRQKPRSCQVFDVGIAFTQPRLQSRGTSVQNISVYGTSCGLYRTLHPAIGRGILRAPIRHAIL